MDPLKLKKKDEFLQTINFALNIIDYGDCF